MKLSSFEVNPEAIEGGEWVTDLPECGDLRIRTRGLNSIAFTRRQAAMIGALPRSARRNNRVDPPVLRQLQLECLVETCLLDWDNLNDENGPIPYSLQKAREYVADPRYSPLQDAFLVAAARVGEARDEDVEAAVGNSQSALSGN